MRVFLMFVAVLTFACVLAMDIFAQTVRPEVIQERLNSYIREQDRRVDELSGEVVAYRAIARQFESRLTAIEQSSESQTWWLRWIGGAILGLFFKETRIFRRLKGSE